MRDSGKKYDLVLHDGDSEIGILLGGADPSRSMRVIPATPSNLRIGGGGGKFGDWDPANTHLEQRTWDGGRGLEDYAEDPTRFYDSQNLWTLTPFRMIPSLDWNIAPGLRNEDQNLWKGLNKSWQALLSAQRYVSYKFTSTGVTADKVYFWIKRVGNPGTLTAEVCPDSGGDPDTAAQTKTVTTSTITDVISRWYAFDWTGTEALAASTDYHVKIYGASTDNAVNHWEIAVDNSTTDSQISSDNSSWSTAAFSVYFNVVDADVAQIWRPFFLENTGGTAKDMYVVNQMASGNSKVYIWDETNDKFTLCTITADDLSNPVTSVAVANDIAHMARSTAETIFTFINDSGTYKGQDDATGGNNADILHVFYDPVDGPQLWRAEKATQFVSRSDIKAFNTDLVFSTDIEVGDDTFDITALTDYNDQLWVRKRDSLWTIKNDRGVKLNVGLDAVFETGSTNALAAQDLHLYFSWSHSIERLTGGTLDDIGPWKGTGLPSDRTGPVAYILPVIGWLFCAIDGGTSNYSSVLAFNGRGFHEVFRAPEVGQRIRWLGWQPVVDAQPRLWISCGTDMIYMNFPQDTLNPLHDTSVYYNHEAVFVSSTIDMNASRLKKYFDQLTLITENLDDSGIEVALDYQLDEDIGGSTWTAAQSFYNSPSDEVGIKRGNVHQIRYRLRLITGDGDKPPIIRASVLEGFARTPVKNQLNIIARTSAWQVTKLGTKDLEPDELLDWLYDAQDNAKKIKLYAQSAENRWNDTWVIIDSVTPAYHSFDVITGDWTGEILFVAREA